MRENQNESQDTFPLFLKNTRKFHLVLKPQVYLATKFVLMVKSLKNLKIEKHNPVNCAFHYSNLLNKHWFLFQPFELRKQRLLYQKNVVQVFSLIDVLNDLTNP